MQSPFTGGRVELIKEPKNLKFRKETFEIVFHSWKCEDTGEVFSTDELDTLNINQVHNKYREKYNIPFPDQVRETRRKYSLSAAKMSDILGFGVNTYRNYESGEVPQISNGKLIKLAGNPEEFKRLVEIGDNFSDKKRKELLAHIELIIEEERDSEEASFKNFLLRNKRYPNVFTGYREMWLEKFFNMMIYFAEQVQPFKTRLNKLMFYSDFLNYKQIGFSISGANYAAIDYGPVPDRYSTLYDFAKQNHVIEIEYHQLGDNVGEEFKPYPNRSFEAELFDEIELNNLEFIAGQFGKLPIEELIDKTHQETAWLERSNQKGLIEYDYAFDLKLEKEG